MPSPESTLPDTSVLVSPSMEVLETLEIQNALSNLEMRLDSLEIDIARQAGTRDDDARRIAGEMAVMKARVEDALAAFAGTVGDLRTLHRDLEKRLADVLEAKQANDVREQIAAGIEGMLAGLGDVLKPLTDRLAALEQTIQGPSTAS